MKKSIVITRGKLGYFLSINNFHIKRTLNNQIEVAHSAYHPNNWICTEWDSISSLRKFWNKNKALILHITKVH